MISTGAKSKDKKFMFRIWYRFYENKRRRYQMTLCEGGPLCIIYCGVIEVI